MRYSAACALGISFAAMCQPSQAALHFNATIALDYTGNGSLNVPFIYPYLFELKGMLSAPASITQITFHDFQTRICAHADLYCSQHIDSTPLTSTYNYYLGYGNTIDTYFDLPVSQSFGITSPYPDLAYSRVYNYKFALDFVGTPNTTIAFSSFAIPIPEPSSWVMLVGGFSVIGVAMRRRTGLVVV